SPRRAESPRSCTPHTRQETPPASATAPSDTPRILPPAQSRGPPHSDFQKSPASRRTVPTTDRPNRRGVGEGQTVATTRRGTTAPLRRSRTPSTRVRAAPRASPPLRSYTKSPAHPAG